MASELGVDSILSRVAAALAAAGVPYMLTGSFASSLHGAPRVTHDIDIVIAPTLGSLHRLIDRFPEELYYVSRDAALHAYGAEGIFNVVDLETGWKVDFIIRKSRPFSREAVIEGAKIFVASAEDVLIAKLEWAKWSESERQLRDAASILATRRDELDERYLDRWVSQLELQDQWEKTQSLAPR